MNLSFDPHKALLRISEIFALAPDELVIAAERASGGNFPHEQVARLHEEPSFENLEVAHHAVSAFLRQGEEGLGPIQDHMMTDLNQILQLVEAWVPFRAKLMTEYQRDEMGNTKAIPHFYPKGQGERFHSLGNAAYVGGVDVSVFDKPLQAVSVYPATEALEAFEKKTTMPASSGSVSSYKVAILDGEIQIPPLWPGDLLRALEAEAEAEAEMDMAP